MLVDSPTRVRREPTNLAFLPLCVISAPLGHICRGLGLLIVLFVQTIAIQVALGPSPAHNACVKLDIRLEMVHAFPVQLIFTVLHLELLFPAQMEPSATPERAVSPNASALSTHNGFQGRIARAPLVFTL